MKNQKNRKKGSMAKNTRLDKDLKKLMDLHREIVKLEKLEAEAGRESPFMILSSLKEGSFSLFFGSFQASLRLLRRFELS